MVSFETTYFGSSDVSGLPYDDYPCSGGRDVVIFLTECNLDPVIGGLVSLMEKIIFRLAGHRYDSEVNMI
jgi:hypothetical protein